MRTELLSRLNKQFIAEHLFVLHAGSVKTALLVLENKVQLTGKITVKA